MTEISKSEVTARKYNKAYNSWSNMKRRCYNPKDKFYYNYGGRGIKVCDRWLESFYNFFVDMGEPEDSSLTLDRIDSNGDYSKENCRWTNRSIQGYNQRKSSRNKTGKTGVHFREDTKSWRVRINVDGEMINIGNFKDYEQAVNARKNAELNYYGYIKE